MRLLFAVASVLLFACLSSSADAATCTINITGGSDVIKYASIACHQGDIVVALDDRLANARRFTGIKYSPKTCKTQGCLLAICDSSATFITSSISYVQVGDLHKERTGVICVHGSSNVTFKDLTVHGNYGSGVLARGYSRVTVEASVLRDGLASGGAALLALEHAQVHMTDSHVYNNLADGYYGGGGIAVADNATMLIERCTISSNTATKLFAGGGLAVADDARVTVSNSSISNNTAEGGGAGIAVFDDAVLVITNGSRVVSNNATGTYSGGGMLVEGDSEVNITGGSVFEGNSVDLDAGGAFMISGNWARVVCSGNSTLRNNTANTGGAVAMTGTPSMIMGDQHGSCNFEGNVAPFGPEINAGGGSELVFANTNINLTSDSVIWTRTDCIVGETIDVICQKCRPGMYSLNPKNTSCDVCPAVGANCTGGDTLVALEGYWHSSNYSTQFHRCLHAQTVCLHGDKCALGYQGPLCGGCAANYGAAGAFSCVRCSSIGRHVAVYILVSMLSVALVTITAHATWKDNAEGGTGLKASHMLHVVIVFLQFLLLISTVQIQWPAALSLALRVPDAVFGAFGGHAASLGCILKLSFGTASAVPLAVMRQLVPLIAPVGLLAAVLAAEVLWWLAKQLLQRLLLRWQQRRRTAVKLVGVLHLNAHLNLKSKLPVVALVVFSVSYPFLVRTALGFFACVQLDDATAYDPYPQYATAKAPFGYWIYDMDEACWSPSGYHLKWAVGLGVPCAVVFCIGVPAAIVLWLSTHVEAMTKDEQFQAVFGFLYRNYREKLYWFEAITRLLMAGVCAVSAFRYTLGAYYAIVLMNGAFCLFFGLQLVLKPFESKTLHKMQVAGFACLYFTAYVSLTFFSVDTETAYAYKQASGGIVLTCIICYLVWCVYLMAWHSRDVLRLMWDVVCCRPRLRKGLPEFIPTIKDVGQK